MKKNTTVSSGSIKLSLTVVLKPIITKNDSARVKVLRHQQRTYSTLPTLIFFICQLDCSLSYQNTIIKFLGESHQTICSHKLAYLHWDAPPIPWGHVYNVPAAAVFSSQSPPRIYGLGNQGKSQSLSE